MHAPPWKFVDRIVETTADSARAEKCVNIDDPLGCSALILIEALAQTAAALGTSERGVHQGYLAAVSNFQFFRSPLPGERVELCASRTQTLGTLQRFLGEARVDGTLIAQGELTFALHPSPPT